ncbi:unnamed protein product [Protopolystoma xenopodis]|uniref:Uncharacterized protein n=1 Tax=Protopolystoma xenopodis TaxID=117903 RepID=A0A448WUJ9_9PLAT|nr:unnamed protein product [Protopolystoma xenopodis]
MSPESVSLHVGLVKRNHLHNRYLVPFDLHSASLFNAACQLFAAYQVHYWTLEIMMHIMDSGQDAFF